EQGSKEVQNDKIGSPSNQMIAEEPEVVLVLAPQVRAPPERFNADSVEDLETMPQRNPPKAAASRQRFRRFCSEDAAGPRDVLRHLQELAGQWLRPNIHTKEQIVEMLVQGQFQAVLPEELRALMGRGRRRRRVSSRLLKPSLGWIQGPRSRPEPNQESHS
uniref:SCAN box domain-containing protein n=1 Tax=Canis lupus dingo TaxID=286419 RepID=A0A8C0KSC6_CANLU